MTAAKLLITAVILGVFIITKVQSIPQYQQQQQQQQQQHQSGPAQTQRPYVSNSVGNLETTTPIPIIAQSDVSNADGSFNFSYEAGNGIKQQSSGFLKKISVPLLRSDGTETGEQQEADILVHTGSYSYTAPDGTLITLNYISDENGFQPQGDHLPTPPPIPEHVISILQQQSQLQNGNNQQAQLPVQPALQQTQNTQQAFGGRSAPAQRF